MPVEHQMPLLLIPLTTQSAFLTISADHIALCTECLHGPPIFDTIEMAAHPPTVNHRGRQRPLWTAWARPFRLRSYSKNRDCIYLAREDGVVLFMEADQDNALTSHFLDPFPCNISGAFACLFDRSTDVLVLGSDSGPGGYWKIPPREPAELLGTLPNWSPVVDVTTTDELREWHQRDQRANKQNVTTPWQQIKHRKPDRIFATCESGSKGSITEYRYGLRANIGLELEYGPGTKEAWLLRFCDPSLLDGYLLLLSMPDSTTALLLSRDFSSATAPGPGTIPYDLSSATLALVVSGYYTIQITRQNIVLVNQHRSASLPIKSLPGLSTGTVSDGHAFETCVAISTHTDAQFQIHVFSVDWDSLTLTHVQTIDVEGEVTCLSLGLDYTVLAGIRQGGQTLLAWSSLKRPFDGLHMLSLTEYMSNKEDESLDFDVPSFVEGIESIISVKGTVLLGTRSGEVIMVKDVAGSVSVECERFGTTAATLSCSYRAGATEPTILACCDNSLVSIRLKQRYNHCGGTTELKTTKLRVWPVDASKLEDIPPPVHYATAVDMASDDGLTPILLISGSRLLLAEMHEEPGPVQRSIPTEGTPNRVLYCQFTQCLVAAVNKPSGPTLTFINPDTGDDIGIPTDKNKAPQTCIAGLGKEGDRIMSLGEWNYKRDGNVWNFILVTTRAGRLIVVTTEKVVSQDGSRTTFRYWTRFRKELSEPIYSVLGFDEGLIYCAGQTIYWEVLDPKEKRLKPLKSFRLGSPATSLRISNGKLVALTSRESLVVLDNLDTDEEGIRLCHVDPWRRNGVDSMEVAGPQLDQATGGIHLVADRECGVAGLWVPWQTPERECEVVLEAELPSSVRKFCRGRTRPVWEQRLRKPRYGRLPATVDDAEILGVSLDGTMRQFTLLSVEAWRLLRFIQNLAPDTADVCPLGRRKSSKGLGPGLGPEPKLAYGLEMHVDGDILRRCLEKRALEWLVAKEAHVARLIELLRELDGGQHTQGLTAEGDHAGYFQLAYDILEYYLSPAL
ncbi:hypothetical protein MYCTH_59585 [Thermothelomyces thermophilus ATCC 42464]|uniref:Uncharacterized protein n=1 Tax=Thermothelomyces thermophilus (strain ATCC 42464 / BCRC 31852 / DSM 1799) TaxID=573729 RepID=G2Q589_THET4|nr:uncharacterized protein MYCTH_59585 [Thermothelomyces thermophilus ATCC 42464]AEO55429.1 hypothetical protein MYCTH_59585 [Thermothelomyces thermophilus ATCC 42464]